MANDEIRVIQSRSGETIGQFDNKEGEQEFAFSLTDKNKLALKDTAANLRKAALVNIDDFTDLLQFQFNPTEYTDSQASAWKADKPQGTLYPEYEWQGRGERSIRFRLFLDDMASLGPKTMSVEESIEWLREATLPPGTKDIGVLDITKPAGGINFPKILFFTWGRAIPLLTAIKSISSRRTHFDPTTMRAIRAFVDIVLIRINRDSSRARVEIAGKKGSPREIEQRAEAAVVDDLRAFKLLFIAKAQSFAPVVDVKKSFLRKFHKGAKGEALRQANLEFGRLVSEAAIRRKRGTLVIPKNAETGPYIVRQDGSGPFFLDLLDKKFSNKR